MIYQKSFIGPNATEYIYEIYDWDSIDEVNFMIASSGGVESYEFKDLYEKGSMKTYELEDGHILVTDGTMWLKYTEEAYSVWTIAARVIEKAIKRTSKNIEILPAQGEPVNAKLILPVIGRLLIDSAELIYDQSDAGQEMYHTLTKEYLLLNDAEDIQYLLFSSLEDCKAGQRCLLAGYSLNS